MHKVQEDLSNVHIYEPHLEAVEKQLSRNVNRFNKTKLTLPTNVDYDQPINSIINELQIDMFKLKNYESYPSIKAEMLPYNKN